MLWELLFLFVCASMLSLFHLSLGLFLTSRGCLAVPPPSLPLPAFCGAYCHFLSKIPVLSGDYLVHILPVLQQSLCWRLVLLSSCFHGSYRCCTSSRLLQRMKPPSFQPNLCVFPPLHSINRWKSPWKSPFAFLRPCSCGTSLLHNSSFK